MKNYLFGFGLQLKGIIKYRKKMLIVLIGLANPMKYL